MHRLAAPLLAAVLALAPLPARPDAQVDAAIAALRGDSSLKVRTQAAIVLGQRGAPEAAEALRLAVTRDPAPAVRLASVNALARLGPRAARTTLRAASQADPDAGVRQAATRALEGMGPVALAVAEAAGTPSARAPAREALLRHLGARGLAVDAQGELLLKPTVHVETTRGGGRTLVAARASLVVVDAEAHVDLLEGKATATVSGTLTDARAEAVAARVVDAALRGLVDDLAGRLGRR